MHNGRGEGRFELDWMFQNIQVSDDVLIGQLVETYFVDLLLFAEALGSQPGQAKRAVQELLARAVVERRQFWGEQPFNVWLFSRALSELSLGLGSITPANPNWDAFQSVQAPLRAAIVLRFCLNFSDEETAAALSISAEDARDQIEQALDQMINRMPHSDMDGQPEDGTDRRIWVIQALATAWLTQSAQISAAEVVEEVARIVFDRQERIKTRVSLKEASLLLGMVLLALGLAWGFNALLPLSIPLQKPPLVETTVVTQVIVMEITTTPQPATPTPEPVSPYLVRTGETLASIADQNGISASRLRELNGVPSGSEVRPGQILFLTGHISAENRLHSPGQDLLDNMQAGPSIEDAVLYLVQNSRSYWETAWMSFEIYSYGPPGYVGLPMVDTVQVWTWSDQPFYWLALIGQATSKPDYLQSWYGTSAHLYQVKTSSGKLSLSPSHPPPTQERPAFSLVDYIHQDAQDWSIRKANIDGWETIAGRPAVRLRFPSGKSTGQKTLTWIDSQTGIMLRRQFWFEDTLVYEIRAREVKFDLPIPILTEPEPSLRLLNFAQSEIGSPYRSAWPAQAASDEPAPGHETTPYKPPPPELDPNTQRLSFQWVGEDGKANLTGQNRAEVFAGGYHLGQVDFTDPWIPVCDRSPDGNRVVFLDGKSSAGYSQLAWFSLDDLSLIHRPTAGLPESREISFSEPVFAWDSHNLAVAACLPSADCEILRLDLEARAFNSIYNVREPEGLAWSPDGEQLAFIGSGPGTSSKEVFIVQVETGELVYRGPYYTSSRNAADDSPTRTWGFVYPPASRKPHFFANEGLAFSKPGCALP